ncbi:MAG: exodeoxyribonuclease VII small subunit [Eubacteriaceae bacterium]|nr:exodeoxyribonuclease VII small subunit [Eubacteriaceae bacterium]
MSNKKTFEDKLQRLEEIVSLMADSNATLTDSVKLFKEGMSLSESLQKELEKAEEAVKMLVMKKDGHEFKDYDEEQF